MCMAAGRHQAHQIYSSGTRGRYWLAGCCRFVRRCAGEVVVAHRVHTIVDSTWSSRRSGEACPSQRPVVRGCGRCPDGARISPVVDALAGPDRGRCSGRRRDRPIRGRRRSGWRGVRLGLLWHHLVVAQRVHRRRSLGGTHARPSGLARPGRQCDDAGAEPPGLAGMDGPRVDDSRDGAVFGALGRHAMGPPRLHRRRRPLGGVPRHRRSRRSWGVGRADGGIRSWRRVRGGRTSYRPAPDSSRDRYGERRCGRDVAAARCGLGGRTPGRRGDWRSPRRGRPGGGRETAPRCRPTIVG